LLEERQVVDPDAAVAEAVCKKAVRRDAAWVRQIKRRSGAYRIASRRISRRPIN